MGMKGNLLYNGDFETGTTEGWENGPFGLSGELSFSADADAKYRGSYGGLLQSSVDNARSFIAYNKTCSFEEYEAFLFIMWEKVVSGLGTRGMLYAMDDKGNFLGNFLVGYNNETGIWRCHQAILRGFGEVTHFRVGGYFWTGAGGGKFYVDEVKLIPLRSIRGHTLTEYRSFEGVTTNKSWYSILECIGRCRLRSIVRVGSVSGTSPTLDITITIGLLDNTDTKYTLTHSQFTDVGVEEKIIDLPEAHFISIEYTVGGTSPSFDIYHHLRIEPY